MVGVPKTIDNDIPVIDKSFGFETSVSESIRAIRSAYVESVGVEYGIGLVRLMGRDAGFIAMEATNASRDVDICLIPEAKFSISLFIQTSMENTASLSISIRSSKEKNIWSLSWPKVQEQASKTFKL